MKKRQTITYEIDFEETNKTYFWIFKDRHKERYYLDIGINCFERFCKEPYIILNKIEVPYYFQGKFSGIDGMWYHKGYGSYDELIMDMERICFQTEHKIQTMIKKNMIARELINMLKKKDKKVTKKGRKR